MPISRQARITRTTISPRLAMSIFLNGFAPIVSNQNGDFRTSTRLRLSPGQQVNNQTVGNAGPGVYDVGRRFCDISPDSWKNPSRITSKNSQEKLPLN